MEFETPPSEQAGLRAVAVCETVKGVLALLGLGLGFSWLRRFHWDIDDALIAAVERLHVDREGRAVSWVLERATHVTDLHLYATAALVLLYTSIRFAEAYGLWLDRSWGSWLGVWSGTIYIPFEIYELAERVTWLRAGILFLNVAIVVFLAIHLRHKRAAAETPPIQPI